MHKEYNKRGCVKIQILAQFLFFSTKSRLSQAETLLLPKIFVTLGIIYKLCQSYTFVLTYPTKWCFFLNELMKILPTTILSGL